jgi:peptidoglycan/LPS O-acetylase OafA/YrhL
MGVTWSLAGEERFYLVLPIMVCYIKMPKLVRILLAIILIAPLLRLATFLLWPENTLTSYVLMRLRADSLLLGVLAAWMVRDDKMFRLLKNNTKLLYIALCALGTPLLIFTSGATYSSTS